MPADTIAFVSTYDHPSRDSIERMLRQAFPEFKFETISTLDVVKRHHRAWLPSNLLYMAREFGTKILKRRNTVREAYLQTTYLFRQLKKVMPQYIDPKRHVFSFQTQSLYDTSVPGVPHFIYTDHTHLSNTRSPYFDRRFLRSKAWIALERGIYTNAACVFTRSSDVTADLDHFYSIAPWQVACVYAGSNLPARRDFVAANEGYSNRHILFVGTDWERKGGPELLEAFRTVVETYPDARLTIVGTNPQIDHPNVHVAGVVPLEDVAKYYASASIFCLPTRLEPFGIAFLEAMSYRLPVVATTEGAVPDMVRPGVNGLLVAPGDTAGIAASLLELFASPAKCAEFGAAGYKHVLENYTWDRVGQRMRERIMATLHQEQARNVAQPVRHTRAASGR